MQIRLVRITLDFLVSFEDFAKWAIEMEEIGGFEYDSSTKRLIITADGGPIHESQVQLCWLTTLELDGAEAGLAPCKFIQYAISLE